MQNFLSGRQKINTEKLPAGVIKASDDNVCRITSDKDGAQVELVSEKGIVQRSLLPASVASA